MRAAVLFLACAAAALCAAAAKDSNGYFNGRATFYTDNQQGSCHFGAANDFYYAAWPDTQEGFPQCGNCFEVSCVNKDFKDGFGQDVRRSSACYDESKTVVVKVIDSCPCVHSNFYSNQRWCCGDAEHIDLSHDVFALLADESNGVIGLKWKQTSCDQLPGHAKQQQDKAVKQGTTSTKREVKHGDKMSDDTSSSSIRFSSMDKFLASVHFDSTPDIQDGQLVLTQQQWDDLVKQSGAAAHWERPSWLTLSGGWRR